MQLQSCLVVRCIVLNSINMEEFFFKLQNYIKQYFPEAVISLEMNEPYWKEPECNEITYQFFNNKYITVTEFITYLALSWHKKKINHEEDVIWSKLCHPEEQFLMPEAEWVHIYTWQKD